MAGIPSLHPLLSKCHRGRQAHGRRLAKEAVGPGQDRASHVHYCLATSALSLRTNENEETEGVVGISAFGEDHLAALIW